MTDTTVIHPTFHHVNLKTTRLQEMIDFYRTLVGAEVIFQDQVGAWLSNDGANHRVALLAFPNFVEDPEKDTRTGMHHSAFEYASFEDLNSSYLRLRDAGITPALCLDHGMTLSYYYADPDGNNVELQVDCFGDWKKSAEWMRTSEEFKANPIGRVRRPRAGRRRPRGRHELRGDSRQGDGGRLRARAGAGRDPGDDVMRLCRFDAGAGPRHGLVEDGYVVDRDDAEERHPLEDDPAAGSRAAAQVPGHRPQLRRPHRRVGHGGAASSRCSSTSRSPAWSVPTTTCTCRASRTCSTTRASWRS